MKTKLSLLLLIFLFNSSCSKEEQYTNLTIKEIYGYAGFIEQSYTDTIFDPPVTLGIEFSILNDTTYHDQDSLDIDGDDIIDFTFKLHKFFGDSTILNDGFFSEFFYIGTRNGFQVGSMRLSRLNWMHQYETWYLAERIAYGEEINNSLSWTEPNEGRTIWSLQSPGMWYSMPSEYAFNPIYIPIKKYNRFGWIEIDKSDKWNPKILSAVLMD